MSYLRIYTPELPVDLKRQIAKEVTDALVRSLELPEDYRLHTTIHFIPFRPEDMAVGGELAVDNDELHYQVEVYDRYLMPPKKRVMAAELTAVLGRLLGLGSEKLGNIYVRFCEYALDDLSIGGIFLNQS